MKIQRNNQNIQPEREQEQARCDVMLCEEKQRKTSCHKPIENYLGTFCTPKKNRRKK